MKKEKKVYKKKESFADLPYLIFLGMLVETKNIFFTPYCCTSVCIIPQQNVSLEGRIDKKHNVPYTSIPNEFYSPFTKNLQAHLLLSEVLIKYTMCSTMHKFELNLSAANS